jgi:hypothetical protein
MTDGQRVPSGLPAEAERAEPERPRVRVALLAVPSVVAVLAAPEPPRRPELTNLVAGETPVAG